MDNKGPILISYLSQIILIIVLLQASSWTRWLTIIVLIATEMLILFALTKEAKWDFQSWYSFFLFLILSIFLLAQILPGASEVTATLSVELILALILGFFITVFSREELEEEEDKVTVVEMEPSIEIIDERFEVPKVRKKPKTPKKKKTKKELFVAGEGSNRYHKPSCSYVKAMPKEEIKIYTSKRQAAGAGLSGCKVCVK